MRQTGASFRDPSGFIFEDQGVLYRAVQPEYAENYEALSTSGLYRDLCESGLLISHAEMDPAAVPGAFKVLKPEQVPFISYPYEWSFTQMKDAALLTLDIQQRAMSHGMSLKDASAFNVQFLRGRPVFIDTLSFEKLEARPWVAYAQFCRHFLAPLALMAFRDVRLSGMLRTHLDGLPLELTSRLLPWSSRLSFWLLIHLHLQAASDRRFARRAVAKSRNQGGYRTNSVKGLVHSLRSAVAKLEWSPRKEVWADYYDATVTGGGYVEHKKQIVGEMLSHARPGPVWDLGSNTGLFSRLAVQAGRPTFAFDGDPECVEINYLEVKKRRESGLLPLWTDLMNPAPALGWAHCERMAWLQRPKPSLTLALALVHHLAIGNNLPLSRIVEFFADLKSDLIVEFVPKDDPNAQKLLQVRKDIFPEYNQHQFEQHFSRCFKLEQTRRVRDSERIIYLMRPKNGA